jgi:hypothetical protein
MDAHIVECVGLSLGVTPEHHRLAEQHHPKRLGRRRVSEGNRMPAVA